MTRLAMLLVLATVGGVRPAALPAAVEDPPPIFARLSFDEAVAKTKATDTILVVKATAVWCPPCKKMDQTTWRDEGVIAWFNDNGLAIQFDVDREPDLAKKLSVAAMPTMIAFVKGEEFDRIVGYKEPGELLAWVQAVKAGKRSIEAVRIRATQAPSGSAEEVTTRLDLARHLARSGKLDEATEELAWLWVHSNDVPGFRGVRGSYLAKEMEALAQRHAPAMARFVQYRDDAGSRIQNEPVVREDLDDWIVLNGVVDEAAKTLEWFDRVQGDASWAPLVQSVSFRLEQLLKDNGRWKEIATLYPDAPAKLRRDHELSREYAELTKSFASNDEERSRMRALNDALFRESAGKLYASLLAVGRGDDAATMAEEAVKLDDAAALRVALVHWALEAKEPRAHHTALLDDAEKKGGDSTIADLRKSLAAALAAEDDTAPAHTLPPPSGGSIVITAIDKATGAVLEACELVSSKDYPADHERTQLPGQEVETLAHGREVVVGPSDNPGRNVSLARLWIGASGHEWRALDVQYGRPGLLQVPLSAAGGARLSFEIDPKVSLCNHSLVLFSLQGESKTELMRRTLIPGQDVVLDRLPVGDYLVEFEVPETNSDSLLLAEATFRSEAGAVAEVRLVVDGDIMSRVYKARGHLQGDIRVPLTVQADVIEVHSRRLSGRGAPSRMFFARPLSSWGNEVSSRVYSWDAGDMSQGEFCVVVPTLGVTRCITVEASKESSLLIDASGARQLALEFCDNQGTTIRDLSFVSWSPIEAAGDAQGHDKCAAESFMAAHDGSSGGVTITTMANRVQVELNVPGWRSWQGEIDMQEPVRPHRTVVLERAATARLSIESPMRLSLVRVLNEHGAQVDAVTSQSRIIRAGVREPEAIAEIVIGVQHAGRYSVELEDLTLGVTYSTRPLTMNESSPTYRLDIGELRKL